MFARSRSTVVLEKVHEKPIVVAWLSSEDRQPLAHALDVQPDQHHRRFLHPFGPLVRFAQVQRREVEDGRLLADRAAVRQYGARR